MPQFVNFSEKKKEQKELKPITRHPLGLRSFDRAFAGIEEMVGFPADSLVEISGPTNCGKSTLIYSLAGMFSSRMKTNVAMVDFEGFNPQYANRIFASSGFMGSIIFCNGKTDESSLDNLIEAMFDGCNIGIIDAIGAISPISEKEGDLGEANMGRRAKLLAQLSRKSVHMMNNSPEPKIIFMNNHQNPILGTGRGMTTPGGETKKYLCAVMIRIKRKEVFPDGSYIIEGRITKNRYGYLDRIFHLFMLVGYGVHPGLTAMYEGMLAGAVSRNRGIVKIGDTSYGKLKDIITKLSRDEDQSFFKPFTELVLTNADRDSSTNGEADGFGETEDIPDTSSDPA